MKKKYFAYLSIVLLVVLNIYLLYKISNVKQDYKKVYERYNSIAMSLVSESSNIVNNAIITHPEVDFNNSGFQLKVFIPSSSCPTCLSYEIPNVNKLYKQYPLNVQVYLVARDSIGDNYNVEFDYKLISPSADLLDINLGTSNPLALLVDMDRNIYSAYLSEIGNKNKSDKFFSKMSSFYEQLEDKR